MADYPPFMNSYGLVTKIFEKIKEAKTPDRFTQDFLGSTLGFSSGSAKPFIPLLKRLGFISSDGKPTEIYHEFRNPNHAKTAMARAIRHGYQDLYERNENVHSLDKAALQGLIVQATGLDSDAPTLRAIAGTFQNLKSFADFKGAAVTASAPEQKVELPAQASAQLLTGNDEGDVRLNLAYTINLVLPRTDDVAVFNAIFRSLRENLLRK